MARPTAREMKAWRDAVMKRDDYRCVVCGRTIYQARLVAHHCILRSHSRALQTHVNNGVLICQESGCWAHDRAHLKLEPFLFFWFDGEVVTWTEHKDELPSENERIMLVENSANSC